MILTPKNKYTGLTIALNKRFSDGWMFHIDYTYSQTKGNHTNTTTASWGGYTSKTPTGRSTPHGYLPYDAPHALNVYGTVTLPLGIVFTPKFTYQSGWNWTRVRQGDDRRPDAQRSSSNPGGRRGFRPRSASTSGLEKIFTFTEKMKLGLILDAFNIFNRGVETGVESDIASRFGKALYVCDPRYFRVGLRLYF